MSTNTNSVASHFPQAQNGFTTTLASTISASATTVPLNSVAGYTNGKPAVFVVDPTDAVKKQTFTGIVDTAGVQITGVVWTAGTDQTHTGGATVVDYATATHIGMISKGITVEHNQNGTHSSINATAVTATNATLTNATITNLTVGGQTPSPDWTAIGTAPNTVTYNGQRSYSLVFNGVNYTNILSPGQRLKTTRTVAAPTQCTSLNGTTQYWNKTSPNKLTFTNNFVVDAYVKLSSYAIGQIASRRDGTQGWHFGVLATGQIVLIGFNGSLSNYSQVISAQSIPLNKWVRVTAQLDMTNLTNDATNNYIMMDGVNVPGTASRGGTNPVSLVQAGNLEIGSVQGGTQPFPGKIAQVAIYNAKVTQANIILTHSQGLAGTETSLASAYSFNGVATDLNTTTPNDLTAQGSAVATNADSPFGTQASGLISSTLDYGIVQSAVFSTNTTVVVQVPEGCTIPTSGGVSAVSYSGLKTPYGFPSDENRWYLLCYKKASITQAGATVSTWYNLGSTSILVPVGNWILGYSGLFQASNSGANSTEIYVTLSTANNTASDSNNIVSSASGSLASSCSLPASKNHIGLSISVATTYYLNAMYYSGTGTVALLYYCPLATPVMVIARNAYL